MQNAFIEFFNGRLRDEFLNETLFSTLAQARIALAMWRADYNGSVKVLTYSAVVNIGDSWSLEE